MVHALQHTQATLLVQSCSPRYLRSTHISYTDQSSIANPRRVHFPGVGPGRRFTADRPNHVYVGDITYLPCKGGKNMYLATVIDAYSRKLVGHALADHMRVSLVIEALSHASKVRGNLTGAIFHSDHGSVYTSQAFQDHCAQLGVRQSMGAVGTSADNALAESFNATLKREVLRDRKVFDNPITCRQEVFRWCMRYNTRRRHSWCNLLAPDTFEALTSATLTQAA